jgi:zinc transporter 1/2/3
MIAVYAIFFAEVAAFRIGNKKMERLGITYNTHADAEAAHGHAHEHPAVETAGVTPIGSAEESTTAGQKQKMAEAGYDSSSDASSDVARVEYDISTSEGVAQLIAVGVLEFGVILHSIIIGLTLSVSDEFITLFIVIIFHRELQVREFT